MMYAGDAAEARGAQLRHLTWPEPTPGPDDAGFGDWVRERVDLTGASLVIGKSMGSCAAPLAADLGVPAVWLTPLLPWHGIADGLRRATAPFLLIGGTADQSWDGPLARELTPHVLEIDGADHGMYVKGPLAASAAVLGLVATAVERFLDEVVWPAGGSEGGR